jgi:ornithine--oxo-acid transaminase
VEPIQGEKGVYVPADDYITRAIAVCKARNVLFIADEIQTGIARTGRLLASCHNNGCSCPKGQCEQREGVSRPGCGDPRKSPQRGHVPRECRAGQ